MRLRRTGAALVVALLVGPGCSLFQQGHHGGQTQATKLDLNSAPRGQLAKLHGLTSTDVDRVIAGRPYAKKRDVVDRGILDQKTFNGIRDEIEVGKGKMRAQ